MVKNGTLLLTIGAAIAVWGVSLAGLASLQNLVNAGSWDFCKAFSSFPHLTGTSTCPKALRQVMIG